MAVSVIQPSFTTGEVAPSLFGHVDLARTHSGASTLRNMYVGYRGGAYSRAGTAYVGFSKQTGRAYPPRLIPFQFNINQGLALEFGNQYMRVVSDGSYVTDSSIGIVGITQANPAVMSTVPATGGSTATSVNTTVSSSYAPTETVTVAGGTFTTPAVLTITNTVLLATQVNAPGIGYVPTNTVNLAGGTQSSPAIITVLTTQVSGAAINAAGTGGTNGTQTVTGTTGTGTKFQASVTIAGGVITAINAITFGGNYTVNPTSLAAEPVTGAGLTGATLTITMGVRTLTVTAAGVFTANPAGLTFTQASTSGAGTGATFQYALLAPNAVTVSTPGVYSVLPPNPVQQASTSGSGLGGQFNLTPTATSPFNTGDWTFLSGIGGMTQLNGETVVLTQLTPTTYQINDAYGAPINSSGFSAYTTGGAAARIYTLPTIYGEQDLEYLKFTQSADVMSICCVNQVTLTEYPSQDLARITDSNWKFTPTVAVSSVLPPTGITGVATNSGTVNYSYVVTSVNPADGTESVASAALSVPSSVDIATQAGSIAISWNQVLGVNQYNVYKAHPSYGTPVAVGSLYGFAGSSYGTRFIDNNITADYTQTPPTHHDPFARGQIISAQITSGGASFTGANALITTATGSGANLAVAVNTTLIQHNNNNIVSPGPVSALIVNDSGKNYLPADTVAIAGDGSGATATLNVGPQKGTYPSVVAYFQERRVYAASINNPDTYWMSKPGAFTNFDNRIPTIASDAISGTPWSVEVNGIQFMISMPGGLVVLTGLSAWQLTGVGGSSLNPQPITPANQQAQPQAYNGCSSTVPPIKIDYDILYVQAKGSIYRDLAYNFFTNIYTGEDLTQNSSHLFSGHTIREHAWCEEPYKTLWAVRDDGILLSLTYNKPQEVAGWARHDTYGLYVTLCSVTEPPVDALYLGVQRFIGGKNAYFIERVNNRIWNGIEDSWCVDSGLSLNQPAPNATLTSNSASGLGAISGVTSLIGGKGYSASITATVVDNGGQGPGTGAVVSLTIAAGVITAVNITTAGINYAAPALVINDPANSGSGASATLVLDNSATFTANSAVFSLANVGSVIRMGNGIAKVTSFISATQVVANIMTPITVLLPNSGGQVQPQVAGHWTLTAPVTTLSGLSHLAGSTITGIADGNVIPPVVVPSTGVIALPNPATSATVGLGFQAQLQSLYLDVGQPTVQGERKKIAVVTARVEASQGMVMGSNQQDGSTLSPTQISTKWSQMTPATISPKKANQPYNSLTEPLYTGDVRIPVSGGYQTPGQVALQQDQPLPMNILALISELLPGDVTETAAPKRQQRGQ